MTAYTETLIQSLTTLNDIADTLNRSVDVRSTLDSALAHLIELMGLQTGWIFLKDPSAQNQWHGKGYVLAAHHNLPPALAPHKASAWKGGCDCQALCSREKLNEAYNEVRCSRLQEAEADDRRGLLVHASAPLRSGDQFLGILNVAAPNWDSFTPEALALLTNVGSQMGIALERARLYDLLKEQRIHEQAALLDFSNQLLSRSDLDDLMNFLAREIQSLLQVDACAVVMPGDDPDELAFAAAQGWRFDPVARRRRLPDDGLNGPSLVMQSQEPLIAEDIVAADPAPFKPDWLAAEGFRGHAIAPLIVEGRSIGVLVINCRRPRLLERDELRFLQLMANQAAIAIEKARLHQEELQRQRLEDELAVGRQIQLAILPRACPTIPGWEFVAVYQAARQVGGDFYDYFYLPGEMPRLGMVIADVADKGVPAALFMALSRSVIRTAALGGDNPAVALIRANELILKDSQTDLFLSAVYAVLNTESGRLIYSNAGHNRPLWYRAASKTIEELSARGIILGSFAHIELEERSIDIGPGDALIFFTDGVTEAMNEADEFFGLGRLVKLLGKNGTGSAQDILRAIIDAYNDFTGDTPQYDDVTCLVVKRTERA